VKATEAGAFWKEDRRRHEGGRKLSPHTADGYSQANLTGFIEESRWCGSDLDLVQLIAAH
jgi:hypothetical protein